VVTVYNPDGQSSAFTLPDGNVVFEYPPGPAPSIRVGRAEAARDSDVVIEVESAAMEFRPGSTKVGVGSSDIAVRRVDVVSPRWLRAVVSVAPLAQPGTYSVSVVSGLQTARADGAFRVRELTAPDRRRPKLRFGSLVNSATGGPELSPGVLASLFGENLAAAGAADRVRATINGVEAMLQGVTANQINLQVSESIAPGTAELRVFNGVEQSEPMLVEIGRVSPGLYVAVNEQGAPVSADAPLGPGSKLELYVTGLGTAAPVLTAAQSPAFPPLQIIFGSLRLRPLAVRKLENVPGVYRVLFATPRADVLEAVAGPQDVAVSVIVDGGRSNTLRLAVRRDPQPVPVSAVRPAFQQHRP